MKLRLKPLFRILTAGSWSRAEHLRTGLIIRPATLVIFLASATLAGAESFGIKFLGSTSDPVIGSAGVVPITGWTNIANSAFASGTIWSSDDSVAAFLARSGPGWSNAWKSGSIPDGGNGSLLNGYNDVSQNDPVTNVISGLKGAYYTVYLYTAGDTARPSNSGDWLPNYTVNGAEYCTATLNGAGVFSGFIEGGITSENIDTYPASVTYGNYIEIDNVTPIDGVITISADSDNHAWRAPLNGIELVARSNTPQITTQPASERLYTGGTAKFSVMVNGAPPFFYQWRENGLDLADNGTVSGSTTNVLTLTDLTLMDSGNYDVVVSNSAGSVTSVVSQLEVVVEAQADMAIDAYNAAFLTNLTGQTYYLGSLDDNAPDGFWTEALDIQGLEDAYERTESPQEQQLIKSSLATFLVNNPPPWSWDGYNDDIGWVSLSLVRGFQMTGDPNFLTQAEYGFNYAYSRGWDTNFNGGGIWEQQPSYSGTNAVSKTPLANDSLAKTACLIYLSTGDSNYLTEAERIYGWVRVNIFNTNSGLVYEEIDTNGALNVSPALYNQGTFVDLANYLYEITGQTFYSNDARLAVEYTRNNLTVNAIFSNGAAYLDTWADEFARAMGHFVRYNNLWSTYYPWMEANANAAWGCRRPDLNVSWNAWTQQTPMTNNLLTEWCVSAVAMLQATPTNEPGLVNCTNKLTGTIIGTAGSYDNSGNTIANVFDNNLATFFDAPVATGAWVGLDFGVGISNVIGQINYWPRTGWSSRMSGGVFEGDNDPSFQNSVTLFTVATAPPDTNVITPQTITNTNAFRYVRYLGPDNGWCDVAELQFLSPNRPVAPASLAASVASGGQINLSWTPSSTTNWAATYVVQRGTNLAGPYTILATGVTATNFSDTTVVAGTTYFYVVCAVNGGGTSANSPQASAVIPYITYKWDGYSLIVSWYGAGLLQQATNLAGPWAPNAGAVSPFAIVPAGGQMFYRVETQ